MPGKTGWFVLLKATDGQFYFNLEAENDEVIATSERYRSKTSALNGIDAVRRVAPTARLLDMTT
ncbi:hypothetical protein FHT40_002449 [Mycolicibacterium sp. BK556]|uniref:YegP family protein n=1 Tax=unclassified Mycolicibacterium TaxID=2636767 RepID=UPI00161610F3|nr:MULTISPECIES: YegP family protein [unclassified Mycolicibacterium]MBB3602788.1 hypothetical protein [Mycolicibacterium sp. BK556]MBB3632983.1 hypothetical protein [Mycolicibacterium sp. BK607]